MQAPGASTRTLAVLPPLLGWRIHARFGRRVGRQRLSRLRPWITLTIFPLPVLLPATAARPHPERLGLLRWGLRVQAGTGA